MSYTTHNINSKPCAYGYRIQSYWNTLTKKYWNFLKKKHICPNCGQKSATTILTPPLLTNCLIHLNCLLPVQKQISKKSMKCSLIS
jgi:rubredoxin